MSTKILEFKNKNQDTLRGVLVSGEHLERKDIVIMLGGFERAASTERKFKKLADKLAEAGVASFRLDAADCGLSDGEFYNITVESLAEDLISTIATLKLQGYLHFSVVGHSLAGCVISEAIEKVEFQKIVLIAPALNQKELLRLWFVQKNNKDKKIEWSDYKSCLDEEDFIKDIRSDMIAKSHRVNFKYRYENRDRDYSSKYSKISSDKILLIHGDSDSTVPLESLNFEFKNRIIIKGGDHDLEKPDIMEQWVEGVKDFLNPMSGF